MYLNKRQAQGTAYSLLVLFIVFVSNVGYALSTDRAQPIKVESDKATIDDGKGIATYEGNVIVTQGSLQINADKLVLVYSAGQTLEKVVATGAPARFKQRPEKSTEDINAKAKQMEYFADKDLIYLTQDAELWQGKDTFTGQRIIYDTQNGVIQADKGSSQAGRVAVTVQPRQKKLTPDAQKAPPPNKQ